MPRSEADVIDPEVARAQLEATRARMSSTLDQIEHALVQKREELIERFDVAARIRQRPIQAAAIVLAAGFLFGVLTGGRRGHGGTPLESDDRAALWESRARRLLRIAREQRAQLEELEAALADAELNGVAERYGEDDDFLYDDEAGSRFDGLKEAAVDRVADFLSRSAHTLIEAIRERR